MYEVLAEIRNWTTLSLLAAGAFITRQTYMSTQKQRRLENSFRLLTLFNESLNEEDLKAWIEIFQGTSEPSGAENGYFYSGVDLFEQRPLCDLFSEGSPDNGAIERMAELFDLISFEALNNTVEFRILYFQLGQLMDSVHLWLTKINNPYGEDSFIEETYPNFARLYRKNIIDERWATKKHTHIS